VNLYLGSLVILPKTQFHVGLLQKIVFSGSLQRAADKQRCSFKALTSDSRALWWASVAKICESLLVYLLAISDSTGTVSGTVSAQNNVSSVQSGNIFCSGAGTCDSPYRKLVCGPWRKVGNSKERVQTADKRRSVPNTCSLHPTGRASGDRPSIHTTANDPGIPRTGHRYHAHTLGCIGMHQC